MGSIVKVQDPTTIWVDRKTKEALGSLGKKDETWDTLLARVVREYKGMKKK